MGINKKKFLEERRHNNVEFLFYSTGIKNEFSKSKLPLSREASFCYFKKLQYIYQINTKINRTAHEKDFILLHRFMLRYSPLYKRIFDIGDDLKIEFYPALISRKRFHEYFSPFSKKTKYPLITEELYWLLEQKEMSVDLLNTTVRALSFVFSVVHEHLHSILSVLIPPNKKQKDKTDYFNFIESLVATHEWQIAIELGPSISQILSEFRVFYKPYIDDQNRDPLVWDFKDFMSVWFTNRGYLEGLGRKEISKRLGGFLKLWPSKEVGYGNEFINVNSPRWLGLHKYDKYPEANDKLKIGPYSKLKLDSFSFLEICDDTSIQKIIQDWYQDNFLRNKVYKIVKL